VVSWNDADDKNEDVSRAAFVIPRILGTPIAGRLPASNAFSLASVKSITSTLMPGSISVSPPSITKILRNICLTTTSMCLSEMEIPACVW